MFTFTLLEVGNCKHHGELGFNKKPVWWSWIWGLTHTFYFASTYTWLFLYWTHSQTVPWLAQLRTRIQAHHPHDVNSRTSFMLFVSCYVDRYGSFIGSYFMTIYYLLFKVCDFQQLFSFWFYGFWCFNPTLPPILLDHEILNNYQRNGLALRPPLSV